jgi:hypothetical protein
MSMKMETKETKSKEELLEEVISTFSDEELYKACNEIFDELSSYKQSEFIGENIGSADEDDIKEAYSNIYDPRTDKDPEEDEYSNDPEELENDDRCLLLADTMRAFNRSRLRPTLDEAMRTVKQMYAWMCWK